MRKALLHSFLMDSAKRRQKNPSKGGKRTPDMQRNAFRNLNLSHFSHFASETIGQQIFGTTNPNWAINSDLKSLQCALFGKIIQIGWCHGPSPSNSMTKH